MTITVRNGEAVVELTKPENKKIKDATTLVAALALHGGGSITPSAAVAAKALAQLADDLARQGEPAVQAPY